MSSNLPLELELNGRIGKASAVMSWENKKLMLNTKIKVYQACVLRTMLYGMANLLCSRTMSQQCLPASSLHNHHVSKHDILAKGNIPSLNALILKRLRWLGHVIQMSSKDGRIPKDMLYNELYQGSRSMHKQTSTTFQGGLEKRHENLRHQHIVLGNCYAQLAHLEENCM